MYEAALVCYRAVAAHQDVVCDRLTENLDFQDIGDDLFCFAVDVWVDEGDVVIACNNISECGESLFDSLDGYGLGEGISQVLELLVGSC